MAADNDLDTKHLRSQFALLDYLGFRISLPSNSIGLEKASPVSNSGSSLCIPTPFERGTKLFNENLTSDSKKRIATTLTSNRQHQPCSLADLIGSAEECKNKNIKQRSPTRKYIENIVTTFNQHAQVIDVLVQQSPDITAVVWGAFRFLIGVAAREIDTSDRIGQALAEIATRIGRWNQFIELFDEFENVHEAASHLFSQIINFLVRARIYFQKPRSIRHIKVGFTIWTQKLEDIMSLIHKYSEDLDQEGRLASEIKHAEYRKDQKMRFELQHQEQEELRSDLSTQTNKTISKIQEVAQTLEEFTTNQDALKTIAWLYQWPSSPSIIATPEEGTCLWVQQSHQWLKWTESQYERPLCICGLPGSGKSTLTKYLASNTTTNITVAYFFQDVLNKDLAKSVAFAAHVLGDLLQIQDVKKQAEYKFAICQVMELLKLKKRVCDISFQALWSILLALAKAIPDFTIIVDGLDECDERSRNELSEELINIASFPHAQIIVLFRHSSLEKLFEDSIILELTPATVADDILTHVKAEIHRYPKQLKPLEKDIIQAVSTSSQGIFVWATMMLECLKYALTTDEQLTYLENIPPGLFQFYDKIVSYKVDQLPSTWLNCRRQILLILVAVGSALSVQELSAALALKVDGNTEQDKPHLLIDPEETVLRLCWPLIRVSKGHVHLIHSTVKEYLMAPSTHTRYTSHITSDEAETYLALKSLAALSQDEYKSPNKIAILIRQNVASKSATEEDKYFYQYAATHWAAHLTAVKSPKPMLVQKAASFLGANQFVSWSEFIFQINGSQGTVLEVESKLKIWQKRLNDSTGYLPLEGYFSNPYRAAADYFVRDGGDKTLPYLILFQLGAFYNLSARRDEAFRVKQMVAEGLVGLLGERDPLALMAESAFALEFITQGRFPEAEEIFVKLAQIQREVLGTERPDCFQSLQRAGMAELWMTKFSEADINLTNSLAGFFNTVGVRSFLYLMSQLTLGQVLEYQGEIKRAILDYEHIWRYRVSILGPDDTMGVWARCAMVSGYRKLGRYEEADAAIGEVIDSRTRTIGPKSPPTIDAIIQRLVLYFDSDKFEDAMELVDFILDGDLVNEWFERTVEVDHVRALLEFFTGKSDSAIDILQSLLDEASKLGVKGRNRSLLWVRLDLAIILREKRRDDEALMLFDDITTDIDTDMATSWDETQAPDKLMITENALRLVRDLKSQEADMLLRKNGLKWVRQEDFWILNGSPAADTGWMKSPDTKEASGRRLALYVLPQLSKSSTAHPVCLSSRIFT